MLHALLICCLFVRFKHVKVLVGLSVVLYVIGVLAKAYVDTPIGVHINFDTRNGPFFSTLLFLTGYGLSGKKINTTWAFYGFIVFGVGCLLHFSELSFLWVKFGACTQHDYVIGTYFMGVGVAMAALSNHPVLRHAVLSRIGQMTLGIYAIHLIFVDMLSPLDKALDSFWWEIGYVVAVLALSVGATWLLSFNKYFRKII
jgi:surface polysaccharide O-acyltransferase-like enzyme